jgi:TRAP-type C4-dicarboxylate transport system permease small subunit
MAVSRRLLDRLDALWGEAELGTSLAVLAALVGSLIAWVALKGLSSRTTDTFVAGLVFRAVTSAVLVGALGQWLWRGSRLTWPLALLAAASAWLWRDAGADYFNNLLGWLQDGSLLTWIGGLRGLGTRLTLWLALLGASLATASGRHVTIDVLSRSLGDAARRPLAYLGGVVGAVVCLMAAWGFFDFSAVDGFEVSAGAPVREKVLTVAEGVGRHLSLASRQVRIDLAMAPKVLQGQPWSRSLSGAQWNELLGDDPRLQAQRELDPETMRSPLLSRPEEASRGLFVKDFNLIVPFGLLMMALRFVLWLLRGAPVEAAHGPSEGDA